MPALLGVISFVIAFAQRPGETYTDSRIELTVDPGRFLGRVAEMWTSSGDLGHVHGGLFAGYLFPQAPWFAAADAVGLPLWIAQRALLGLVLFLAAWGVVRLMDALWSAERGIAHLGAGLFYAISPYVVVSIAVRGTVPLLAYAALPWILLAVHRGVHEPSAWRWPAAIALAAAAAGGSINLAHVLWIAFAAAGLLVYESAVMGASARDAVRFAARSSMLALVAGAWWLAPLLVQAFYGADFQQFAEQPTTIWATTSMSESLRLLGFWVLYLGTGFGELAPELGIAEDLLFRGLVVVATFGLPLLAFGGLRLTRGWSYAPFFGLLAVAALLIMAVGFPPGTPLRKAVTVTSDAVRPLEVLRTTYKAAPLLALAMACLGGAAIQALTRRSRPRWAPAALLLLPALACLPLVTGRALDSELAYGEVPSSWRQAMADADRRMPEGKRILVLPGDLFAHHRWGFTLESVAPSLTERPVAVREAIRYADPRSAQLLDVTDDLVQQDRLVPGQLGSLMRLMGVGRVLVATDGRPERSGALRPAGVAQALAREPGFEQPAATFGPARSFEPPRGRSGATVRLPELLAYRAPVANSAGVVRVRGGAGAVVEGDAHGLAALAAHGRLDGAGALSYAGDLDQSELEAAVRAGSELVFTDSARRRTVTTNSLRVNQSPTVGPVDPIPAGAARFVLFDDDEESRGTVALYDGLDYLRSPLSPDGRQLPEHRPFAALDGRLETQWLAHSSAEEDRYLELRLSRPRAVAAISVHPNADSRGRTARLAVQVNGGDEREVDVAPGWNRIALDEPRLRTLRLRVSSVERPPESKIALGGIDELRVPGLRTGERLRLPTGLARAAAGLDLADTAISVLLQRTTADFPYRAGLPVGPAQKADPVDQVDAEEGLEREVDLPVGRTFGLEGWASADPSAPDWRFDAFADLPQGWRFAGSPRFEGVPGRRASSAFDRDSRTAWAADFAPGRGAWLSVRAPRAFTVSRLRLALGPADYLHPTQVRIGGELLEVGPGGLVALGRPLRTRELRMEVVRAAAGPRAAQRNLRAVAVSELRIPGLRAPAPRRVGPFSSACGEVRVEAAGTRADARVSGSLADLDAGHPLRLAGCGEGLALPAGSSRLSAPPGSVFRPDHVRLSSGESRPVVTPGRVTDPGHGSDGRRVGVRLALSGPAWLVLGESYSRGWRAWCTDAEGEDRALGEPEPVDGFANGWRVDEGCREARFAYAPQRVATAGYALSGAGVLVALALLAAWWLRSRGAARAQARLPAGDPLRRPRASGPITATWRAALVAGAAVALLGGFLFALRAGLVLGPATVLLMRWGPTPGRLIGLATGLLAAVPLLYLVFPARDRGGYSFDYALDNLGAHWAAVAAVCLIAAASAVEAVTLRRSRLDSG